jgi:hypothetical protein
MSRCQRQAPRPAAPPRRAGFSWKGHGPAILRLVALWVGRATDPTTVLADLAGRVLKAVPTGKARRVARRVWTGVSRPVCLIPFLGCGWTAAHVPGCRPLQYTLVPTAGWLWLRFPHALYPMPLYPRFVQVPAKEQLDGVEGYPALCVATFATWYK